MLGAKGEIKKNVWPVFDPVRLNERQGSETTQTMATCLPKNGSETVLREHMVPKQLGTMLV